MNLYGKQTVSAIENFDLHYCKTDISLIYAMVQVKKAAALAYLEDEKTSKELWRAIVNACEEILSGAHDAQFPVEALQGGAGTSVHMNVNEVIAYLAHKQLGSMVHPIDDVNRGQSTNDVFPTAVRIACITRLRRLSDECAKLQQALQTQEIKTDDVKKLARTELMDAVPTTMGVIFGSYAQAIGRDRWRIYKVEERLRQVNLGGTAIGNGLNANRNYRFSVIEHLRKITNIGLSVAEYPMDITQNNDVFVEVSGLLKALAVNLMKISNDIRLMSSGPLGGFGEMKLPDLQQGSSIMPGKVNPVISEMTMQVAIKVMANDTAIAMAAAHGELELNAFLPLIAHSILESLHLLEQTCRIFRLRCIDLIVPNATRCEENLEKTFAFATAYTQILGYDKIAAFIAQYPDDPSKVKQLIEESLQIG